MYCIRRRQYQRFLNILFWVVSVAQLVASMSGVVLGGVVEVVGSNLARGKIFTASIGSVGSLYPSVYIEETLNPRFTKEFILDGIKLILENNIFCFNDTYFKQVKGTAMGTKFAPVYATLTIGYLEEKLLNIIEKDYDADFQHFFKTYWKRFLDDCFIPWTKSEAELKTFHGILNNLHKDIKFTIQSSPKEQPFLDVMVQNKDGRLETDIYYKETDSKQYLLFTSCHPRHTKLSIPYNLARRLRTIISEQNTLEIRLNELKSFLLTQKYPKEAHSEWNRQSNATRPKNIKKCY